MKTASLLALIAAAGVANAGVASYADLSGMTTNDAEGSVTNVAFTHAVGMGDTLVTAVSWDLDQTAGIDPGGASWLSEMTIAMDFDGDGINDLYITPSATNAPGTEFNSSGGFVDLGDAGIGDLLAVGGTIDIELFESFVDSDGSPEGIFNSGTVGFLVPAPGAAAMLGLGGLVASRRRR